VILQAKQFKSKVLAAVAFLVVSSFTAVADVVDDEGHRFFDPVYDEINSYCQEVTECLRQQWEAAYYDALDVYNGYVANAQQMNCNLTGGGEQPSPSCSTMVGSAYVWEWVYMTCHQWMLYYSW
jgi:hypothetical protein